MSEPDSTPKPMMQRRRLSSQKKSSSKSSSNIGNFSPGTKQKRRGLLRPTESFSILPVREKVSSVAAEAVGDAQSATDGRDGPPGAVLAKRRLLHLRLEDVAGLGFWKEAQEHLFSPSSAAWQPALAVILVAIAVQLIFVNIVLPLLPAELLSKPRLIFAMDSLNLVIGWGLANTVLSTTIGSPSLTAKPGKLARVLFNVRELSSTLHSAVGASLDLLERRNSALDSHRHGHGHAEEENNRNGAAEGLSEMPGAAAADEAEQHPPHRDENGDGPKKSEAHGLRSFPHAHGREWTEDDALGGLARCFDLLKMAAIETYWLFDQTDALHVASTLELGGRCQSIARRGTTLKAELLDTEKDTSLSRLLTQFQREVFRLERLGVLTGSDTRLVLESKAVLVGSVEEISVQQQVPRPRLVDFHLDCLLFFWIWLWLPFSLAVSLDEYAVFFYPVIAFMLSGFRLYTRWLGDPFSVPPRYPVVQWLTGVCSQIDTLAVEMGL
jgi:hypothetical protein